MAAILQATALHKRYRMGEVIVNALNGVDFAVQQGEFVAIMGPSGSGKSTLMHLLGGLDTVSEGEITLDGRCLTAMSDDNLTVTRRRDIGFVFQFFNLMPTLTAAENIALPLLLDAQRIDNHQRRIDTLLELVDLSDRKNHKPSQLSGGQQQRVAIARALVTEPKLVLADEPTGNLASAAGKAILQLLRDASDQHGQTIIMVTHDKQGATFADRVVFLKDGRIVHDLDLKEGPPDKSRTQEIATVALDLGL